MEGGLYIAGTGSFAAEVAGWANETGLEVAGLIAIQRPEEAGSEVHGLPVVAVGDPPLGGRALLGLGGDRKESRRALTEGGWTAAGLRHPTAHVSDAARVSPTATIAPRAVVGAGTEVGGDAILSRGVLVGHHARIDSFATLNPGVNVGGNSTIGEGAFLGMGCVVVNAIEVGAGAIVAAGAVAIADVAAGARVQGVPAVPHEGG